MRLSWFPHQSGSYQSRGFKTQQISGRSEILTVASLKIEVFWDVMQAVPDVLMVTLVDPDNEVTVILQNIN